MINMAQVLGRVGRLEVRPLSSGMKVCNMSLVTSKKYVKNGVKEEKTTWHNITLFNKLAEIAENYVAVGDLLYVQGEIDNQKYTDNHGVEKLKSVIIANEIKLMPKSKEQPQANKQKTAPTPAADPFDDPVPW